MNKPRAFIHLTGGSYNVPPSLVIGRVWLPLPVIFSGAGLILAGLLIYAFVVSIQIGWANGFAFFYPLGFLMVFASLWALIGVVNLIAWMVRETMYATKYGRAG